MRKTFGIGKTTFLGGVFFLLPFAVLLFLIGQVAKIIYSVAGAINSALPKGLTLNIGFVSLATVLATALIVLLCYLAGLAAQRSFARRFNEKIEKQLLLLFPRYAILKDQMASNLGGQTATPQMKPVLVRFDDRARIGFEVERGEAGAVTVYLPGSPDPWQGHVEHVAPERVSPLAADFGEAVAVCESLGRQASRFLSKTETAG